MADTLDFKSCLIESIRTLNLKYFLFQNINDDSNSLAIVTLPGGTVTRSYMDGVKDKALPYEIRGKTKDPEEVEKELTRIAKYLGDLEQLKSNNGSFEFMDIRVSDEPFFEGADDEAYFHFSIGFTANITVF